MRRPGLTSYTRYEGVRDTIGGLCEPEIAAKIKPVWGLDDECEMNSAWRDCGVENLWITLGIYLFHPADLRAGVLRHLLIGNISVARSSSIPLALREFPKHPEFSAISYVRFISRDQGHKGGYFQGGEILEGILYCVRPWVQRLVAIL